MERNSGTNRSDLRPPRFSLTAIFSVVSIFAVFFATATYVGVYATLLLVLFVLTILAHVAGNAIGTHLRDTGSRHPQDHDNHLKQKNESLDSTDFAPTTQLHQRTSLGTPIVITTTIGSVTGAIVGGYGLSTLMARPTWYSVVLAILASAVLGGIWTFVASSFLKTAASAVEQASRDLN